GSQTVWFGYQQLADEQLTAVAKIALLLSLLGCIAIGSERFQNQWFRSLEPVLLLLLSCLGMICMISAQDWITFYLSFELQSLCLYVLAGLQRHSGFSTEAALKYFVLGAFSSCLLVLGISLIYGSTGIMTFEGCRMILIQDGITSPTLQIGLFLIVTAIFFKLAAVPFHMWSPDVYEGAPTAVSTVFAVVPKLALTIVLFRILHWEAHACLGWLQAFLLLCGVASMIIGSFLALVQVRLKRLLAYSGISHVGYLLISMATEQGVQATLLYVVIYMITALFLWGFVLASHIKLQPFQVRYISDIVGFGTSHVILALSLSVVLFSLGGIPPLAGFFAKVSVFFATIEAGFILPSLIAVLTSVVATYYYIRLIKSMFFEKGLNSWVTYRQITKSHAFMLGICTAFLVFFSVFPNIFFLGACYLAPLL
ncbi:unnamed protein product, partial [Phaeothamnion confervicola]